MKKRNALAQQVSGCCKAHANNLAGFFTPLSLANLVTWIRADDVVLTGTDVIQVNDKSGNGLHLDVASANNPQFVASDPDFNGQAVMSFELLQNNWLERTTGTFIAGGYNVFAILKTDNLPATKGYCATGTFLDGAHYVVGATGTTAVNSSIPLVGTANLVGSVSLLDTWWDNAKTEVSANGVIENTGNAGGNPVAAGFVLGSLSNKTNSFDGSIAEIVITSSHLDDMSPDYAGLMSYFNLRYGLNLPTIRT